MKVLILMLSLLCLIPPVICDNSGNSVDQKTITDSFGRDVTIPSNPERIALSGRGSMRYFVYLGIDPSRIVGVDMSDSSLSGFTQDPRPYILAQPEILDIDTTGSKGGVADPEKILSLNPDILFIAASSPDSVKSADEIQEKTGIPTFLFYTGNFATEPEKVTASLQILSEIFGKEDRAKKLLDYLASVKADLTDRVSTGSSSDLKAYACGISYLGEHGVDGTNPNFLPFAILKADNVAADIPPTGVSDYAAVSKEKILSWDPDLIFVSLGTLNAAGGGAINELQTDPSYKEMTAVKNGEIYGLLADNSMGSNYETSLANTYYVGKILYPEKFTDIDPAAKADEIFTMVDGGPAFEKINQNEQGLAFQKIKE
jgi:iron complex transport system substrate-binding protein